MKVVSWKDFLEKGKAEPQKPHPPNEDDLASIMYTSGTTGTSSLMHAPSDSTAASHLLAAPEMPAQQCIHDQAVVLPHIYHKDKQPMSQQCSPGISWH